MASRGHRVIACAQRLLPTPDYDQSTLFSKTDAQYPSTEYCFVSLTSLEDPPKHGVREAIGTLRLAGIKVMMVTGDHPKTAEAIARKINLIIGDTKETLSKKTGRPMEEIYEDEVDAVVVHGDDIDGLQGWQWDQSETPQKFHLRVGLIVHDLQSLRNRRSSLRVRHLSTSLRLVSAGCGLEARRGRLCSLLRSQTCAGSWSHCWSVSKKSTTHSSPAHRPTVRETVSMTRLL